MTEERIGGISVGVVGTLAELEASLAKAESMVAASTKRMAATSTFPIGGARATGGSASTAAAQGGSASSRQTDLTAFTRAIGEATTRLTALVAAINSATSSVRTSGRQSAPSGGTGVAAALSAIASNPTQAVRARVAVDRMMPHVAAGSEDATKALRRKNLRDRGIGTEVNPNAIYTYEPESAQEAARAESAASRSRHLAVRDASRRSTGPSAGEQGLLSALYPDAASRRLRAGYRLSALGPNPGGPDSGLSSSFALPRSSPPTDIEQHVGTTIRRGSLTPEQIIQRDIQREREARRTPAAGAPYRLPESRAALTGGGGPGSSYRPKTDAEIDRMVENRLAVRESQTVSAGRTPRTGASTLGGFYLGGGRQRIADESALSAAVQKRNVAERSLVVAEDRLRDPKVIRDSVAKKHATEELTVAQGKLTSSIAEEDKARRKVESYSGLASGVRNLAGAALGGAAFGLGLEAVGVATKAAERAAAPYFDAMTGWAQKTADLTNSLADQARQAQGNAKGVTALYIAQTGLADSTAATVSPIIAQRAQIEAGNKAIVDQVQTLRDAQNLSRQGANAGIVGGGTGGILGTGIFGTASTGEQIGNYLQSINDNFPSAFTQASGMSANQFAGLAQGGQVGTIQSNVASAQANAPTAAQQMRAEVQKGVDYVNAQLVKGGDAAASFTQALDKTDPRIEATAKQFDGIQPEMAKAVRELSIYSTGITDASSAISAFKAINLAGTQIGPSDTVAAMNIAIQNAVNRATAPAPGQQSAIQIQQAHQLPSFIGQQVRSAQYAQGASLPMQAYLANLAAPPTTIGSSIAAAGGKAGGAAEQAKINAGIKDAQGLQSTLDGFYAQGQKAVHDTYDPGVLQMFGQAGVQAFDGMIAQVGEVGAKMSSIQSSMNMEQAQYAAAQYTNEIRIASRSLTDIRQLTGQIGASAGDNLGIYERQNLLLGRQGQQLQFMLSQRQINFQTAIAGFQVPGLTPAEQNARVQEAKTEASYAQKQLDIQKQMFGNQVKVVDIGNLRQATDMIAQLGLLRQGRAITVDIALKQESLTRLNKLQAALMAQVNTYTSAVDSLSAKNIANLAEIESATGKFIGTVGTAAAQAAFNTGRALYLGITGGMLGSASVSPGFSKVQAGHTGGTKLAGGALFDTSGSTNLTVGEAGHETVAVLRNPRSVSPGGFGGGGGDIVINLTATLDGSVVYRDVIRRMGRDAAMRGLRSPN